MKWFLLAAVVAFACSTMAAMASDIAFYVGEPNSESGWYDVETILADVSKIENEVGEIFNDVQIFDDDNPAELQAWTEANLGDGELDIIWTSTIPNALYPIPNKEPDGSLAEMWLDTGNMIIYTGDYFAFSSFEGGIRSDNGFEGAKNILDQAEDVIIWQQEDFTMEITNAGKKYMPSIGDTMMSDRPIDKDALTEPWEVAEVFGKSAEGYLDPVVLHNTETDGYVTFINCAKTGDWIDRGIAAAEFIKNWGTENLILPVEPAGKLSTTWGILKAAR